MVENVLTGNTGRIKPFACVCVCVCVWELYLATDSHHDRTSCET